MVDFFSGLLENVSSFKKVGSIRYRLAYSFFIQIGTALFILALIFIIYGSCRSLNPLVEGGSQPLHLRVLHYLQSPGRYDLVFVGDSRTYCGLHPEHLDPLLGTRSINLSTFAHWLPTQYPMVRDFGSALRGKTVVWSIGHQNFQQVYKQLQFAYPVDLSSALRLIRLGVPTPGLWEIVAQSNPLTRLLGDRNSLRLRFEAWLGLPTPQIAAGSKSQNHGTPTAGTAPEPSYSSLLSPEELERRYQDLRQRFAGNPTVRLIMPVRDHEVVRSVVLYRTGGGYERVELDQAYFRWQQAHSWTDIKVSDSFVADPSLLALFEVMLGEFRRCGANLIVNEVEEAPFMYSNAVARKNARSFMSEVVQKRVEAAGFHYVRADWDQFQDDDYFDFNHLNSKGISKYSPLLAQVLAPYIGRK